MGRSQVVPATSVAQFGLLDRVGSMDRLVVRDVGWRSITFLTSHQDSAGSDFIPAFTNCRHLSAILAAWLQTAAAPF